MDAGILDIPDPARSLEPSFYGARRSFITLPRGVDFVVPAARARPLREA